MQRINTPKIRWDAGIPISDIFDDVYFTKDGGVEETEHVFIQGNQLLERFTELAPQHHFVIAETGFGTGLNFLVTRQRWLENTHEDCTLHFVSFEKYPLRPEDIQDIWHAWPELTDCKDQFLAQYPPAIEGFHTLFFDQGRVKLTLIIGELLEQLPRFEGLVDAWFLDGFAPSKNPDMWHTSLYHSMARLSGVNTTLATYTVAQRVREGLTEAGFSFCKAPGFGHKRYILTGQLAAQPLVSTLPETIPSSVIVVGAGLAGASTARALADAGMSVVLLESMPEPALKGSGNAQGALYAKLAVKPTPESALHLHGLRYSTNLLRQLPDQEPPLASICGVLQLALNEKEVRRQQQLSETSLYPDSFLQAVTATEASLLMGATTPHSGLFFPQAGWVAPADYCRFLLNHPRIDCHFNQAITTLVQDSQHQWTVHSASSSYRAAYVVICTAAEAVQLEPFHHLPIKPIRGQTSHISVSSDRPQLKTVVCGEGYISPPSLGQYCFGATFDLHDHEPAVRHSDHLKNIAQLARAIPAFNSIKAEECSGRTGFRCSTADYLPIVGKAADFSATLEKFSSLRIDATSCDGLSVPRLKGLFINTGHGSKGLITCPISAAVITAMICELPSPLPNDLATRLDPARFILRDLRRSRI